MLWHIEPKFCILLFWIKYQCRQFASIFVGGMPLLNLEYRKYAVFCTFLLHVLALTYWDENLHMTLFYYTTASIFLGAMLLSEKLEYWKYRIFCSFVPYALTYCAELLYMTFFLWNLDHITNFNLKVHSRAQTWYLSVRKSYRRGVVHSSIWRPYIPKCAYSAHKVCFTAETFWPRQSSEYVFA